jgi:hypothetical protein
MSYRTPAPSAQYAFINSKTPIYRAVEEKWDEMQWHFKKARQAFDEEDRLKSPDEFYAIFATFMAQFEVSVIIKTSSVKERWIPEKKCARFSF